MQVHLASDDLSLSPRNVSGDLDDTLSHRREEYLVQQLRVERKVSVSCQGETQAASIS